MRLCNSHLVDTANSTPRPLLIKGSPGGELAGQGLWWVKVLSKLKRVTGHAGLRAHLCPRAGGVQPITLSGGLFLISKMQRLRTNSPTLGGPARSVGLEVSECAASCHPGPLGTQSWGTVPIFP